MNVLYEQKQFPVLQNRVYETTQEAIDCPKGDIKIVEDTKTGLVYNAAFDPDLMVYDGTYNNEQGLSPSFKLHLERVADLIEKSLGRHDLIEVGCGKAFFLEMLLDRGIDITGFDSTYEGVNTRVIKKYFEPGIIEKPAKGLILRHVLEHIQDPYDFLCQLRDANGGSGIIYIEVPCFDWILSKRAWFDIFYEHVNYFRLSDFDRMFEKVIDKGRLFGDQYLYIVADLSSLRKPMFEQSDAINFPKVFLYGLNFVEQNRTEQNRTEQNRTEQNRTPVCIWGGASKGVIFSLLCKREGFHIDAVIDVNPAKQRRFLPATGIEILSPERAMAILESDSCIYVMNSNYREEIKLMSQNKFNYIGIDQ